MKGLPVFAILLLALPASAITRRERRQQCAAAIAGHVAAGARLPAADDFAGLDGRRVPRVIDVASRF